MKRWLVISMIAFFIANIASSIVLVSFNRSLFNDFYTKNATAETLEISLDDLNRATDHLLSYIVGDKEDLDIVVTINDEQTQMFNQREIDHMVDVKDLYNAMVIAQVSGYAIFLISSLLGYLILKKQLFSVLLDASKAAIIFLAFVIGTIAIMAIVDFNSFWNTFHHVLFDNDLWLLNPLTDRMIVMVPLHFFQQLIFRIVLTWVASVGLWFLFVKAMSLRSEL